MGDFLLDLRPKAQRRLPAAAAFLRFYPDMRLEVTDEDAFGLVTTSADDPEVWGGFTTPDGSLRIALCGRIAFEEKQWEDARRFEGAGGLAGKALAQLYRRGGIEAVEQVSGNFAIILYDRTAAKLFVLTDRGGFMPAFEYTGRNTLVYSSHPDALADAVGEERDWDLTSFAEFILAGKLSFPFTYYRNIRALPCASRLTVDLRSGAEPRATRQTYFAFDFNLARNGGVNGLVDMLAGAFKTAAARRTLPLFGKSALALSGGLDSRMLLCAAEPRANLVAFTCFDEENPEFRTARSIARAAGVEFIPLRRNFDYYADHAALGVRISAGMGCIASNHFLGFRQKLAELGVQNLLTGCYCDYLFKGLGLNKQVNRWTFRERLGGFAHEFYAPHAQADTPLGRAVTGRFEESFPAAMQNDTSERGILEIERKRIFPFHYEADNAERVIPQRVMGWFVPIAENALLDVYLKLPCEARLNRSVFERMVEKVCGRDICRIPDANTGAPVGAGAVHAALASHARRVKSGLTKLRKSVASLESWPNWNYYVAHSPKIRELWSRPNADATDVFRQVLGPKFNPDLQAYVGKDLWVFMQLFTLKLWFDQRACSARSN